MVGFNGAVDAGTLHTSDVVNNLTSTATDKPGSANMLKTLYDKIVISSGTVTEVKDLTTSGMNYEYQIPSDGYYSIKAGTTNTAGVARARITVGNTIIMDVQSALYQYDMLLPPPLFFKAGLTIKGMASFPSGGDGKIVKIE